MTPLPAAKALDQFFLDARARLLDLAAILDRLDRGGGAGDDPRVQRIRQAVDALKGDGPGRAEQVQTIFSLAYEPGWTKPPPKQVH